ncbi:MAG: LysR family transcriptional regulator [Vulcanimicrobiaceae bacterium]|jgi:DNA-binding transcriptional LysR family regulator
MTDPPLNLTQLATFVRVARERSFTRAAAELHLTQPAVTQQIRALERDLGVTLVDVVARRATLTEAGVMLAERADRLLAQADAVRRDLRDLAEARGGTLHVGATVTIGGWVLPQLLARFRDERPGVTVDVRIANTATIGALAHEGTLSLALVEGDLHDEDLAIEPFADDALVLIVAPAHPFARRDAISVDALAGQPFVAREEGSGTREQFERALRAAGVVPRVVLALPAGEGIVRAVASGIGIAIVSQLVVADAVQAKTVVQVPVRGVDLRRRFTLVRRRWHTPSAAVLAFEELARQSGAAGTAKTGS